MNEGRQIPFWRRKVPHTAVLLVLIAVGSVLFSIPFLWTWLEFGAIASLAVAVALSWPLGWSVAWWAGKRDARPRAARRRATRERRRAVVFGSLLSLFLFAYAVAFVVVADRGGFTGVLILGLASALVFGMLAQRLAGRSASRDR